MPYFLHRYFFSANGALSLVLNYCSSQLPCLIETLASFYYILESVLVHVS